MIGMMIGRAALRGAASATSKGATPPKDVKPTPCHPLAIVIVLAGLAAIVAASLADGGQVVGWITPAAVVMGLVILGGMFAAGVSESKVKIAKIKDIPGNQNAVPSAAELNAYYATLRAEVPEKPKTYDMADFVKEAKRELASQPKREYKSLNLILAEEEVKIRRQRVNDILKADCPTCEGRSEGFCTFQPGQSVVRLDEGIIIHSTRVSYALKMRLAKLDDVKAQFKGSIPQDIIAGAL